MSRETIAIIGAGMAGLAAGVYGQMNGFECRIFEHGARPGGVCTAWRRQGYTCDGCIQWLLGATPGSGFYRVYEELGIVRDVELLPIEVLQHVVDERSGARFTIRRGLEHMERELLGLAPADAQLVRDLIEAARRAARSDFFQLMDEGGLLGKLAQVLTLMRDLPIHLRFRGPYGRMLGRIKTPQLHRLLEHLVNPDMPAFVLPALMGWMSAGLARVGGGSDRFAEAVARRFHELGGRIEYGATVARVLVENDRAVGVALANGETIRADRVISAADGRSTIFDMLGGQYTNARISQRYRTWQLFPPILLIHYGAAMSLPSGLDSTQFVLDPVLEVDGRRHHALFVHALDYDPGMAPPGHSVVQVSLETSWERWSELARDPNVYAEAKAEVAAAVLERLEPHLPGLRQAVQVTDVATPVTYWRLTRNHRGAYEGWLPTPRTMLARIEKKLPGLERFYMAGQWVEPGGGVPIALTSGRNAIKLICREADRPFRAEKAAPRARRAEAVSASAPL